MGLAAPQVGQSLWLAVIEDRTEYHKTISESDMKERGRTRCRFTSL